MVSRRHLRIKVMQTLFAYFNSGLDSVQAGEKELTVNVERFFDLFLYQISLLPDILQAARNYIEDCKNKHLPDYDDLNPSTRFVDNPILNAIADNQHLKRQCDIRKISWVGEFDIPRRIFTNFRNSKDYEAYITAEENTFEKDKSIIVKLIRNFILDFVPLTTFYGERSIFWIDDLDMANVILIKPIKALEEKKIDAAFDAFEFYLNDEDRLFAKELFAKTVVNSEKFEKLISENTLNWELERIAFLDIILMKMALIELTSFPSIPIKVTLNEYIELAKEYSTPKSSIFINGVLDKLITQLKESKKIRKTGRGLK
jgi:transcription antitermination protein NusB